MGEWIMGSPAHAAALYLGLPLQVWLDDGSVRTIELHPAFYAPCVAFTDCTYPEQNMLLGDIDRVQAWRLAQA